VRARSAGASLLTRWFTTALVLPAFVAACGDGERPGDAAKQPPVDSGGGSAGDVSEAKGGRRPSEPGVGGGGQGGRRNEGGRTGAGGSTANELAGAGSGAFDSGGSDSAGAGGDPKSTLRGRVVDFTSGRALPNRRVVVGASLSGDVAQVVETDADGSFTFEASGRYQALIIDPDGSTVSFYDGLLTRDPVLLHHPTPAGTPPKRIASVNGTLSGVGTYPLTGRNDMVVVHLLSDEVSTYDSIGGDLPPHGPDYGIFPGFDREPLTATLLALGIFRDPMNDKRYSAALAMKQVTLLEGENAPQDLELTPVELGRFSGEINVPAGWEFEQTSGYYRMPIAGAAIGFPYAPVARIYPGSSGGEFDYEVPNLYPAGGQLCLASMAKTVPGGNADEGWLWTEKCGINLEGPPVSIDFEEAPTLVEPAANARFSKGTRFVWSRPGSPGAPNLLELYPSFVSSDTPGLSIFTTSDSVTLPDLEAWGVKLPASVAYGATPIALWSDANDAFGSDGFGALIPEERRTSYRYETRLVVGP